MTENKNTENRQSLSTEQKQATERSAETEREEENVEILQVMNTEILSSSAAGKPSPPVNKRSDKKQ